MKRQAHPGNFMSGFALIGRCAVRSEISLGILHKPFTSESLVKVIRANLSR